MLPCSTVTSTVCSPLVSPSTTKASVLLLFADSVTCVSLPSTLTTISHASFCRTFSANLLPVKLYLIVPLPLDNGAETTDRRNLGKARVAVRVVLRLVRRHFRRSKVVCYGIVNRRVGRFAVVGVLGYIDLFFVVLAEV